MIIPAPSKPLSRHDIEITVGTVKATDSRATGGTIQRGATHADLHINPVVWLEDKTGVEHAFQGSPFADARTGQDMVVVINRSSHKILRVYNLATRAVTDSNELIPVPMRPGDLLFSTLTMSIVAGLPFFLLYTMGAMFLRKTFLGRASSSFDLGAHFPYAAMMLVMLCFWLLHRWISNSHVKAKVLSELIDDTVKQQGLIK